MLFTLLTKVKNLCSKYSSAIMGLNLKIEERKKKKKEKKVTSRVCSLNMKIDHQYSLNLKIEERKKKKEKKVTPRVSLRELKNLSKEI